MKHILNSVATPRVNGQVERYNRTILASLGAMTHGKNSSTWDTYVPKVQSGINTIIYYPWRRENNPDRALIGVFNGVTRDVDNDPNHVPDEIRAQARELITKDQLQNKNRFDRHRKPARAYSVPRVILLELGGLSSVVQGNPRNWNQSFKVHIESRQSFQMIGSLLLTTPLTRKGKPYENVVSADKIFPWLSFDAPLVKKVIMIMMLQMTIIIKMNLNLNLILIKMNQKYRLPQL